MPHLKGAGASLVVAIGALCCANLDPYVWADSLPDPPANPTGEYLLAPGDVIFVRVFNQEGLSGRTRVRPDGRVTIPLLNDIQAAGRTTQALANSVQDELREFIKQAVVTI